MNELGDLLRHHYNTLVAGTGLTCLGIAAGVIGSFLLLRKRALLSDALSHATLPGVGMAFILLTAIGYSGKELWGLLLGATVFGLLGILSVQAIARHTRLKEDAAIGIVLSVYYGLGVAVLGVVQSVAGEAAGLKYFIYGRAAAMVFDDAVLIAGSGGVVLLLCLVLFREFKLLCFDRAYAASLGYPIGLLDLLLMALIVAVVVIGLQAVGVILVVALLIIPAAAARFWTNDLARMVIVAAVFGGLSSLSGAAVSASRPRLATGAVVVIAAGVIFFISMFVGPARGVLRRVFEQFTLRRKTADQHLLRELYEWADVHTPDPHNPPPPREITLRQLLERRGWSRAQLKRALRRAQHKGWLHRTASGTYKPTASGMRAAWRVARNHRLWELYLITHAEIAPSQVDRDADRVEHVLGADMITELEELLASEHPDLLRPDSPHRLGPAAQPTG